MWIITLLLGVVIYWLISGWINGRFSYWEKRGVPYSKLSPFRFLIDYLFKSKTLTDIQNDYYKKLDGHSFGGYFQLFTPSIMIRDPELVSRICVKDFSYFVDRNAPTTIKDLFTETLGNLTGDKWRALRHSLTPAFTSGKLKMMFKPIKECSDEVLGFIKRKTNQDIEARDFMFKYVVNVVGNTSFGLKVDALNEQTENENEFLNVSKSFFKPSFILMVKFMLTMTMPKISKYLNFNMVDEKIDNFFRKLVHDMIEHRKRTGKTRHDFLQLMLDQKNKEESELSSGNTGRNQTNPELTSEEPEDNELHEQLKLLQSDNTYKFTSIFTDDCIISQTFNFISGGTEATSTTLNFVLYELSANPDLQKKVQDEIDHVMQKNEFDYEAVNKMKYMEKFINESIRLHSVFQFITRVCTQNYQISGTDAVIEKGSYIVLPIFAIQKDGKYFTNPEKFDPDRFSDDNASQRVDIGFGCGPRMCIAKRLALLQIKILLATILRDFTVTLSKKTQLPLKIKKSSVFQHVVGGMWIQFKRREFN